MKRLAIMAFLMACGSVPQDNNIHVLSPEAVAREDKACIEKGLYPKHEINDAGYVMNVYCQTNY